MRSGRLTRTTGRLAAALAFALLGACQSIDSLESLLDRDTRSAPPPQIADSAQTTETTESADTAEATAPAAPQVREQRPAGSPAPASTQSASASAQAGDGDGLVRLQRQAPADAGTADTPQEQAAGAQAAAGQDGNGEAPAASAEGNDGIELVDGDGEAAPADDGANGDETGRRVVDGPTSEGLGGDITRRFNSLFGSSTSIRQPDQLVEASEVTGTWTLEEEDGLRTCAVTLASPDSGSLVQPAQDCSGLATRAARWSIFGSDLLLSTADNTVVARLRRSGNSWIGFTLETGIPLVLSRQATSQG